MLLVALILLLGQLWVRQKHTVHILFAIFCGSIAMMAAKQLANEQLGVYQYLIGMGACATCNCFWLVSRALFRDKDAIELRHIIAAGSVGVLLIAGQGLGWLLSIEQGNLASIQTSQDAIYELINLFSSCMLVLTAWEGCRGFSRVQGEQRQQRLLFLGSYCSAVLVCTVLVEFTDPTTLGVPTNELVSTICAIQIMLVTQLLIYWRFHHRAKTLLGSTSNELMRVIIAEVPPDNNTDQLLAQQIKSLLEQQDMYLQSNLKVADLARQMNVSEYRISRVFRDHFNARNFNQFINHMRVHHAKRLLENPDNTHWPIIVVGMESGFASIGPFTRAFKSTCGMTPNQYRQYHQAQSNSKESPLMNEESTSIDIK